MSGIPWQKLFTRAQPAWKDAWECKELPLLTTLGQLRHFLDLVHTKYCLVKPYQEYADYPLVEARELMPSFEPDLWEHKLLPGFSLLALARPLSYFSEVFQFDLLRPLGEGLRSDHARILRDKNQDTVFSRLPRALREEFRRSFQDEDITGLACYSRLISFLTAMDRAHVFGLHGADPRRQSFFLAGVFASLPSDLDTEIKRYGQRIAKFSLDDPDSYEENRNFVFQRLMELYGFPVASERRTSAALFARRLHKMGERFLIRTLSQSDRTLTTLWNDGGPRPYPQVEKIALVSLDPDQKELIARLEEEGYCIDPDRHVIILRVVYRQHEFSPDNVRQERALSVDAQFAVHPLTGFSLPGVAVIRDTTNMILRLNDIVRGEYAGRISYKRNEIVENTDTEEKRLKFLYAWLTKHQRRIIGYSDEFFAGFGKVLEAFLFSPDRGSLFGEQDLYRDLLDRYSYILQARKVRVMEELREHTFKGERIGYRRMLSEAVDLLHGLKFEIVSYFDSLVSAVIAIGESMLNDRYLLRSYVEKADEFLTPAGLEIKRNYGKLVSLLDEFKAIRKRRAEAKREE
ncbi:MAG: hypothetical protein LBO77_05905 [Desulfovibrio sp.]|jgi:hypothetical protein|nr:hypothetical protein [Desulfovibrio sp.]